MIKFARNPLDQEVVEKLAKFIVPCCKHVKSFLEYQNDVKKNYITVPEWKDEITEDVFLKHYNRKYPLDTNDTQNSVHWDPTEMGYEKQVYKVKDIIQNIYKSERVDIRNTIYYPPTGYMGWHTNCESPGERLYITWASEDKKSFFRYYDHEKDEIITDYDDKGITVRQFTITKSAPYFWHCVGSECDRFSFGFRPSTWISLNFDVYQKLTNNLKGRGMSEYVNELLKEHV